MGVVSWILDIRNAEERPVSNSFYFFIVDVVAPFDGAITLLLLRISSRVIIFWFSVLCPRLLRSRSGTEKQPSYFIKNISDDPEAQKELEHSRIS